MIIYKFDVEYHWRCDYDSLSIYDGGWTTYPLIVRMCGVFSGTSYTTTKRRATLVFITDSFVVERGFEIDYYFHKKHIGGPLYFIPEVN